MKVFKDQKPGFNYGFVHNFSHVLQMLIKHNCEKTLFLFSDFFGG